MFVKYLRKLGAFIYETIQSIVVFLSIFVFIYYVAAQPHQVQGDSMLPNFESGEYILTDKVSYRLHEPERGDIVVFQAPNNPRRDYIKRIVGMPGETVSLQNNTIFINGKPLKEEYLSPEEKVIPGAFLGSGDSVKLGDDEYFVLGDNRDQSQDSRSWGPIGSGDIVGRVFFRYWPPQDIGKVQAVEYSKES